MPVGNPIDVATARIDPSIEASLLAQATRKRALLVGTGPTAALSLAALVEGAEILVEERASPRVALLDQQLRALRAHPAGSPRHAELFAIGGEDPASLTGCGALEGLERCFRAFLDEFIMTSSERRSLLARGASLRSLVEHASWAVAFESFFGDDMRAAVVPHVALARAATLRRNVEAALARDDVGTNPYLHHLLLGHFLEGALPPWLSRPFDSFTSTVAVSDPARSLAGHALVSIVLEDAGADAFAGADECDPGAFLVLRSAGPAPSLPPGFDVVQVAVREQTLATESLVVAVRR
jgi:hypothetical protein